MSRHKKATLIIDPWHASGRSRFECWYLSRHQSFFWNFSWTWSISWSWSWCAAEIWRLGLCFDEIPNVET